MGLLNIGVTSLLANQSTISTIGHNIANANVEGYSRQESVLQTQPAQFVGGNFIGNGVELDTIRRVTNEFLTQQLRVDTASFNGLNSFSQEIGQLDQLIAGDNTGLAAGFDSFFSSLQAAADSPTSLAARQLVLSEGERLAQRFNVLQARLDAQTDNVNDQIRSFASEIDQLGSNIAALNQSIIEARAQSPNDSPNDLLDQRDEALRQLAELVSFSTTVQDGDIINVFIGGGQPLVLGAISNNITTVPSESNPARTELAIVSNGNPQVVSSNFSGGALGGLLRYRDEVLDNSLGTVGVLAVAITSIFNAQHRAGVDLNGGAGVDFFTPVNNATLASQRITAASDNGLPNDRIVSLNIDDITQLTGSDYQLSLAGSGSLNYSLLRLSDGVEVGRGTLSGTFPETLTTDQGFSITLTSGSFQDSDRFIIQPTRFAASELAVNLQGAESLALGSPVVSDANSTNTGTGAISQGGIINVGSVDAQSLNAFSVAGELTPPLLIQFTSATTYDVLDNSDPLNPQQLSPPLRNQTYLPNQENPLLPFDADAQYLTTTAAHVFNSSTGLLGTTSNGYPDPNPAITSETITVTQSNPDTGALTTASINILNGESAATAAARINTLNGVVATANTEATIEIVDDGDAGLLSINLNGVSLTDPPGSLPNPITTDSLADRINQIFAGSGISATSNGTQLFVRSVNGDDLQFQHAGFDANDRLDIVEINGVASSVAVTNQLETTIGGTVDLVLDGDATLTSTGGLFTNPTPQPVPAYIGYQVNISGAPQEGDTFTIGFNGSGAGDNRNALALVGLQTADILEGDSVSIIEAYGQLVAEIGARTASANLDREASSSLLTQTTARRDSVAGVNLDEEAARLIQFQQAYTASAQLINVARQLFDDLLAAF